jgi:hypothetical protein
MTLASICFRTAVVMGLVGLTMGVGMGMAKDFSLMPVHAHVNLLGWVSFFLYGAFYFLVPAAARGMLPKIHYALSLSGMIIMLIGVAGIHTGYESLEILAVVGSLITYAGFLSFVAIVFLAKPVPVSALLRSAAERQAEMPART